MILAILQFVLTVCTGLVALCAIVAVAYVVAKYPYEALAIALLIAISYFLGYIILNGKVL